jgi:beta-galactosidase/beta-glucuronidase
MTLPTSWGESLESSAPLPEHPRPQLVRPGWQSLNGRWECAFTPFEASDPLDVADPLEPPAVFDNVIVVPFSPETTLSGVGRATAHDEILWYRRRFKVPVLPWPDARVLLHFGAVDQSCRVAVDGVEVGGHSGGYLPFTLDISAALGGGEDHELVVAVRDVTDASWLSRGKQASDRGGIWYTPQSGIWQTVWLEVLPRIAVDRLVLVPDLDAGTVVVTVLSSHGSTGDDTAQVVLMAEGMPVADATVEVGVPTPVALAQPVRTWSPDDPFLYDVEVCLGEDRATSYVGMRSFGVGTDARGIPRLLLNGQPFLPIGLLDQGYWPDGGYTAPADAALEYDVTLAKALGYNMLRKHIKVEPLRWYHHCDRLGMLVWQDAVNGGHTYDPLVTTPAIAARMLSDLEHHVFRRADAGGRASFERELVEMIELLRSVPSVALWVPFNEGWGQFDTARIAEVIRTLDPTRPVDHASGWHDQGAGDVLSLHVYLRPFRMKRSWRQDPRVLALTEYGGYSLAVPGHTWGSQIFGYKRFQTGAQFEAAFVRLHDEQIVPAVRRGLAAVIYTQLADVEDEVNGLVTYDRKLVKIAENVVRAVNARIAAASLEDETA